MLSKLYIFYVCFFELGQRVLQRPLCSFESLCWETRITSLSFSIQVNERTEAATIKAIVYIEIFHNYQEPVLIPPALATHFLEFAEIHMSRHVIVVNVPQIQVVLLIQDKYVYIVSNQVLYKIARDKHCLCDSVSPKTCTFL